MKSDQEKLANFERIVLNDALALREEVTEKLAKEKREALKQAKEEVSTACNMRFNREVDWISRKTNEYLIKNNTVHKETLLNKREELIQELFDQVAARLQSFVNTKEYESFLQQKIDEAAKLISSEHITLELCERDKRIQFEQNSFLIKYVSDDMIGGFIMIDAQNGLLIDETFASKLSKQREEFLELCHLQIA